MLRLLTLALVTGLTIPAAANAQSSGLMTMACTATSAAADDAFANLHGNWDFLMVPRGQPSFGQMSIGFVGAKYGGSLTPARTAPVVMRAVSLNNGVVRMVVASREGDVSFEGRLSARGDIMCGTVTYHGGETFPMIAHKRPSTYQSPSQAERARH